MTFTGNPGSWRQEPEKPTLTESERMQIFMALVEKVQVDGFIPAPPWWMAEHPNAHAFWNGFTPEVKISHWIAAGDDDYIALVEFLLKRHKEMNNGNEG